MSNARCRLAIAAAALSMIVGSARADEAASLRALFDEHWQWLLREYPAYASELGDPRYNDRWTDETIAAHERRRRALGEFLAKLETIDAAKLSPADRLNRELMRRNLADDLRQYEILGHLMPVNHMDGIQNENDLADALPFTTLKHYEDWLARLHGLPEHIEQVTELLREGKRRGMLPPRAVVRRVPDQVRKQLVELPSHSLYFKPFRTFPVDIDDADRRLLTLAAQQEISDRIVPAYRKLLAFLEDEYLPACPEEVGAWRLPNGQAFYAERCRRYTTTDLSPDEIHAIGLAEVKRIRGEMDAVMREVGFQGSFAEFAAMLRTDPRFYFDKPDDLLAAYRELCQKVDPQLPKLFKRLPRTPYDIQPVPDNMAPDVTTAYYRPPSADGSRPGTYFVNLYRPEMRPKYEIEALSLHEAVPGHHLQIALAGELGELPEFRRYGDTTAYVEGWGLYSERLGADLGLYRDPYSRFGQLTYEIWRAIRLVVDTGMHHKRWTRDEAIDYFKQNAAKSELDIVNEVDRYIAWPGQALAYKIGELKILELRAKAEKQLGDRFDIRDFHDVVLRQGAVPLDVLEQLVDDWLAEAK